nr:uncharacterized protein LOC108385944 [Manis javanica]
MQQSGTRGPGLPAQRDRVGLTDATARTCGTLGVTGAESGVRCHDHLALPRVPPQKPLGTAASSPWAYPRRNPLLFHLKPAGRSSVSLGQGFLRQPLRPGLGVFVARFFKALRRFSDAGVDACAGERGCRGLAPDSQPESRELQALRGRCGKVAPSLGEDYPWDGLNTVPSRRPNPQEPCLPASAAARGSRQDPPVVKMKKDKIPHIHEIMWCLFWLERKELENELWGRW